MRRWRVGTLSMGLVLISMGLLMILSQFNEGAILNLISAWWPLVLFLLGGEVLWFAYGAKEDSPKIKYDIFSIFIVSIIVICSLGLYSMQEIGLVTAFQRMVFAQNYVIQVPEQVLPVEAGVKKIVVQAVQYPVTVRLTKENQVRVLCSADVTADSRLTAEKLLEGSGVLSTKSGDALYLSFNSVYGGSDLGYHGRIRSYTLLIPEGKDVEIENDSSLLLQADNLIGRWLVNGPGGVEIRVKQGNDLQVNVSSDQPLQLGGNIKWTERNHENGEGPFLGTYLSGKGINMLDLIGSSEVNFYQTN